MQSNTILLDLQRQLDQIAWKYQYVTGQPLPIPEEYHGEAPKELALLRQVVHDNTVDNPSRVMAAYENILHLIHPQNNPPAPDFWQRPIGQLLLQARLIATQDKLMTITQAATVIGRQTMTLSTWIARGQLPAYNDPEEHNPRRRWRVLISEVRSLIERMDRKPK